MALIRNIGGPPLIQTAGLPLLRNETMVIGLVTGADPLVLTNSFNIPAYVASVGLPSIPAESATVADPLSFGAVGDGVADDTAAVQNAMNSLPSTGGGTLDLSNGIFGVVRNTDDIIQIGSRANITVKGGGWSDGQPQTSGLRVLSSQNATGNGFDAVLRWNPFSNNTDLVIKDLEIDGNGRPIGGITTQKENGAWIIGCYLHDFGNGTGNTLGCIKGADTQTGLRIIGCIISDTAPVSGASAIRGIFTTTTASLDCWFAHNVIRRTAHTGISLHQGNGAPSVCEFNTLIRNGETVGGAALKPELDINIDTSTFNPAANSLSIYRGNYCTMERSVTGNSGFAIQIESMGCLVENNFTSDNARGIASFTRFRNNTIRDNVFELNEDYGIYLDTGTSEDKSGHRVENNTITRDGQGMDYGVFFGLGYNNSSVYSFDNGWNVNDNLILDALITPVLTRSALDSYVAGDPGSTITNNGPAGSGATNVLIKPSYAP